jgi:hypothetical protein
VNDLEQRLSDSLVRRAQTVGPVGFTPDDLVHAGRSAVVRRRVLAGSGALAIVVAVAVLATNVLGGGGRALPPTGPTTPPVSPPSSVAPTPASAVGLAVVGLVDGKTVGVWPNGHRSTLDLPVGLAVLDVTGLNGGWLVHARAADNQSHGLWLVPDGKAGVHLTDLEGNYVVAAGGYVVAVVPGGEVVIYDLGSRQEVRRTTFPSQAFVVGFTDAGVLLREPSSDGSPTMAGWWRADGVTALTPANTRVNVWSVTSSGQAPMASYQDPAAGQGSVTCLNVVTLTDSFPTPETGYCPADEAGMLTVLRVRRAMIAGGGDQLAVESYDERRQHWAVQMVTVADLNAGLWQPRPTNVPLDNVVLFWDSRDTFVTASRGPEAAFGAPYSRCGSNGTCTPLTLPTDLTEARVVPVYGGG